MDAKGPRRRGCCKLQKLCGLGISLGDLQAHQSHRETVLSHATAVFWLPGGLALGPLFDDWAPYWSPPPAVATAFKAML
jgi:hypothetical protein